jgi:hypothetical protein
MSGSYTYGCGSVSFVYWENRLQNGEMTFTFPVGLARKYWIWKVTVTVTKVKSLRHIVVECAGTILVTGHTVALVILPL